MNYTLLIWRRIATDSMIARSRILIGSVFLAALAALALVAAVPAFALPGYTDVISSNVTPSRGGEINNFRVTTAGDIPSVPDEYADSVSDVFAYVWIAAVDCSQYNDSNCGGNHSQAVFAILDTEENSDGTNWRVVNGSLSIHPLGICNGNQAVSFDTDSELQSEAKIAIKGHKMTLTLDADLTPVTPSNFTSAGSVALFTSSEDSSVTCVGSLSD